MEYTYKQIQDYFYNNNLEHSDTIYNDNVLLEQCQNELYDIDGNFMEEVK